MDVFSKAQSFWRLVKYDRTEHSGQPEVWFRTHKTHLKNCHWIERPIVVKFSFGLFPLSFQISSRRRRNEPNGKKLSNKRTPREAAWEWRNALWERKQKESHIMASKSHSIGDGICMRSQLHLLRVLAYAELDAVSCCCCLLRLLLRLLLLLLLPLSVHTNAICLSIITTISPLFICALRWKWNCILRRFGAEPSKQRDSSSHCLHTYTRTHWISASMQFDRPLCLCTDTFIGLRMIQLVRCRGDYVVTVPYKLQHSSIHKVSFAYSQ